MIEWLEREFQGIRSALDTLNDFNLDASRDLPDGKVLKDRDGMLRYVPDASLDPKWAADGFNYFSAADDLWHNIVTGDKLSSDNQTIIQWVIDNFSVPGYGGLYLSTPAAMLDLGATWQKITVFDAVLFSPPDAVIQNLANESLAITEAGVWVISINFNMQYSSSGVKRETYFRIYNETDGTPIGSIFQMAIASGSEGASFSVSLPIQLSDAQENKEVILQIGNGSTITGIQANNLSFALHHVSAYAGEIAPI
jgi:hypothetical protein